jgi:LysR family transcriptional regulator, glycine cleavage system transcriptional activator
MSQPTAPSSQFPLHELLAFEAAARHGSFQKAADELSVTQSAVSHRVINLERRLGVALFDRKGRGITLSKDGASYLDGVSAALTALWTSGEQLRQAEHSLIRVMFAPSIGSVWLLPHLPEFMRNNPGTQIEVASIALPEEVSRADWDVLVHYGSGSSEDARRVLLITDELLVVGNPEVLTGKDEELTAEAAAQMTVLRHTLLNWSSWSAGAFGKKVEPARYLHFDDSITMLEAAVSGAGIAVATRLAAAPYLDTGALKQIHPFALKDNEYYVEISDSGELKPVAKSFVDWMTRLASGARRIT